MQLPPRSLVAPERSDDGTRRAEALHVLIVDDDEINRLLVVEALSQLGTVTMQAADGAEAVALACELEFDLILMDLQMPTLDGVEATKQIRAFERLSRWARVPIVAYSSSLGMNDARSLRDSGVDGVLSKPCAATELTNCLQRWCSSARVSKREGVRHLPG